MPPTVPSWLSAPFLEKVIRNWRKDKTISIVKTEITPATEDGDNYSSDMFRVNLEYSREENNKEITDKLSVIVKAALKPEGVYGEICEKMDVFDTEISMMTSTLREMEAFLDGDKLSGTCIYAQHKDPTFMIIEDLNTLGFRMAARHKGLDLQHCLIAMRGLAKFHAASVYVCEKNPELKTKYKKGMFSVNAPSKMISAFNDGAKHNVERIVKWPEIDQTCKDKVIKAIEHSFEKAASVRQLNESEFNVINHGDFWINNMLFRYDDEENPVDLIFVDFQYCVYASPAVDLQYFLNTSPSEKVCINHTDDLINEYHQTLSKAMKKHNLETKVPTMSELKKYIEKLEFYGFEAANLTLPIVLKKKRNSAEQSDGDDVEKEEEDLEYRRAMTRRLKYWNDAGLLDEWKNNSFFYNFTM